MGNYKPIVKGLVIDQETRCEHYHLDEDRIAIKFFCCQEYFPCYECHEQAGCGEPEVWPKSKFQEKAILCGACGEELTITAYIQADSSCPACYASFNPKCERHYHLYFETS